MSLNENNSIGAVYLREYFRRWHSVREARRTYLDVDGRRRGAVQAKHEAMHALIDREQELDEWLRAVGIDPDNEAVAYA